ncbi:MAG: PHP domain-containing protein [Armatimonadetes bacterium]|nr:PHP domain-containing protein [Armatimonadota bacterium]
MAAWALVLAVSFAAVRGREAPPAEADDGVRGTVRAWLPDARRAWGSAVVRPVRATCPASASGPGWYDGDTHSHTRHSDGGGTVADNAAAAIRAGLSFLFITDHNTLNGRAEVAAQQRPGFLCLTGEEVTAGYGHANAYQADGSVAWEMGPQAMIRAAHRQGGILFLNHPYFPGFTWQADDVEGHHGIEVWNGLYSPGHEVNRRAFALWDRELNEGERLVGLAGSDAHKPAKVGNPRICAYLEALTPRAVHRAMRRGTLYGTNGPDVRFTANGAPMGTDLRVAPGAPVAFKIAARSAHRLTRVTLIRNGAVLREWAPAGPEKAIALSDTPTDRTWYRVEVADVDGGFAFSNPIWVETERAAGLEVARR